MPWWRLTRWIALPLAFLPFPPSLAAAEITLSLSRVQDGERGVLETAPARVRIHNTHLGAIEATADAGKTWRLVGRVEQPVLDLSQHSTGGASGGGRERQQTIQISSTDAFRVDYGVQSNPPRDVLLIQTATTRPVFDLLLEAGPLRHGVIVNGHPVSMAAGYSPSEGDTLLLAATPPSSSLSRFAAAVESAATAYQAAVEERLQRSGQKPVTGYLTVTARSPSSLGHATVVFLMDGAPLALINRPPYTVRWDTRSWSDGEHLIEVRALDATGAIVTRSKQLIVVRNTKGR